MVSFNLDSPLEEFGTVDHKSESAHLIVKEKGSGGLLSSANTSHNYSEKKRCPNCNSMISVITEEDFMEAKESLGIGDDKAIIELRYGDTLRYPR
jgi:hypothetical protein